VDLLRQAERGAPGGKRQGLGAPVVGVGEADEITWVSVAVFEEKARELAGLVKGAEVL
jgi:hypothetical protein